MSQLQAIATVVGCLVAVAVLQIVAKRLTAKQTGNAPYARRDALLSPAERSFLGALELILPEDWRAFAKVRLADLLFVERSTAGPAYVAAFNRVSSKHADFVICETRHLRIVGVIELDDRTHERERGQKRDAVKDEALRAAGIPILRVKAKSNYNTQELRDQLRQAFSKPEDSEVRPETIASAT